MFNYFVIAFVVFDLFLVIFIVYRRSKRGIASSLRKVIHDQWMMIHNETDTRYAVLQADKLLDIALKAYGYQGSLGDKLKKAEPLFSNIDRVWNAHKVRNRVAHELDFKVDVRLRNECLRAFEQAFKDLKAL
ncbi:hypothetical protein HZA43_00175 [Candidatus Peregrinibacteria bacterium]|nr:hypothetical protein [Candidatus Peregrinibacteria bacterium]